MKDPFKIQVLTTTNFREIRQPQSWISCAKEQESRCLLHPDWMNSLASSNQRGVTA